jgi:hypothetical protein
LGNLGTDRKGIFQRVTNRQGVEGKVQEAKTEDKYTENKGTSMIRKERTIRKLYTFYTDLHISVTS